MILPTWPVPWGRAGPPAAPRTLHFPFLGRQVQLSPAGVLINGQVPEDPRDQVLLYNYVDSGGGRTPDGTWVGLESLPNSISKVRTLATYCEDVLAQVLGRRERLDAVRAQLPVADYPDTSADLGLVVAVLPMLPLCILFWAEAREESFPARAKVLFDHHVLDILDIESLIFASERMAERIREIIEPA